MKINHLVIPLLLLAPIAHAQTYNFDIGASNTGWIEDTGNGNNNNSNYLAGSVGANEYRNYFTFDLSNVLGKITDASISITLPSGGVVSSDTNEIFALSSVDSVIGQNDTISGNTALFNDLGNGGFVGSTVITNTNGSQSVIIDLNEDFLTQANNSSAITLGGSVISLNRDGNNEYLFGFSSELDENGLPNAKLNVTVDPNGDAVPEPSSTLLIGLASIGFTLRRRR